MKYVTNPNSCPGSLTVFLLLALANAHHVHIQSLSFTLRISGKDPTCRDSCEGSLNLVDLAGPERPEKSGAGKDKDRLKETKNINKCLSLRDIAALGEKGDGKSDDHIPYRNSKVLRS